MSIAKSSERERVRRKKWEGKSEKEKVFRFFSFSFSFSVIYPHIYRNVNTHEENDDAWYSKRERGLGKWNTANGLMTPWHTFHGSSQRKWKESTDLRSSDLWHTYLTNCTSSNYVSSSLNVDRKTRIRNTRLLRDENYIRSFLIDIFTRWRLRADCTNRLCKSFFATRVMFTYI